MTSADGLSIGSVRRIGLSDILTYADIGAPVLSGPYSGNRVILASKKLMIQDNKNCHDDYPKTLAFQVPLRYYGSW